MQNNKGNLDRNDTIFLQTNPLINSQKKKKQFMDLIDNIFNKMIPIVKNLKVLNIYSKFKQNALV